MWNSPSNPPKHNRIVITVYKLADWAIAAINNGERYMYKLESYENGKWSSRCYDSPFPSAWKDIEPFEEGKYDN